MKRVLHFLFAFMMIAAASFSAASCDILGSLSDLSDDEQQQFEEDGYVEGWTEEGNKMVYKLVMGDESYKMVYLLIFEFSGDTCKEAEMQIIFPDAITAGIFYAAIDADKKHLANQSGNKVILDCTEDYKGLSKSELKEAIDDSDSWM